MESKEFKMINKTEINAQIQKELINLIFKTKYIPVILLYELVILLFLGYSIVLKNTILIIIISIIVVLLPIAIFISNLIYEKRLIKSYEKNPHSIIYEYSFYDNFLKIHLHDGSTNNQVVLKYSNIYQVMVTKNSIFLFATSQSAYAVNKDGFEKFDYLVFESMIKPYVKKYKVEK